MKLLTEIINTVQYLPEKEGDSKKHYIQGLFLEFDTPNKNKRVYRSALHDPTVEQYIQEKVRTGRAWGECDHPEGPTSVSLKNASHLIKELKKEGKDWYGKAELTHNALGNLVVGLLETGGNLGVSSRGLGSLKSVEEGVFEVQADYKIITAADIVSDPSAHGALVRGIMENVEYFYDETSGAFLPETSEQFKNKIHKMTTKNIEEKKGLMFERFLEKLRNQ